MLRRPPNLVTFVSQRAPVAHPSYVAVATRRRGPHRSPHRAYSGSSHSPQLPEHLASSFSFWPGVLSVSEQRTLLSASLQQLDSQDPASLRKKRAKQLSKVRKPDAGDMHSVFAPDELYNFHEGHYDGVIHHYREMHLSRWPDTSGLPEILERLLALCPDRDVQTHLLHLASYGDILPHVDNVDASGTWILGVSLGDERVLRMEATGEDQVPPFELLLPSGSVYLQRDDVRYKYKHSVSRKPSQKSNWQRLSVLFRDKPTRVLPDPRFP